VYLPQFQNNILFLRKVIRNLAWKNQCFYWRIRQYAPMIYKEKIKNKTFINNYKKLKMNYLYLI